MDRLPKLSLNNRSFIALVCVVITVIGVLAMNTLRRELIPSISLPVVAVVATNPGASSEQMAERVADPIERQLRTMEQVSGTSAQTSANFTMIVVEMDYGSDIYRGASQADVILSRVSDSLPDGTTTQVLTGGTGDIPAMIVSVASDVPPEELAERLDAGLLPEIGSVDGVATVQLLGAPDEIISLEPDEEAMASAQITQADIVSALDDAGLRVPGGSVTDGTVELPITVGNEITSVEDIESLIIVPETGEVAPVALGDVVGVSRTNAALDAISRTDGRDSVTLLVTPAVGANFIEISDDVNALLEESAPGLGDGTAFTVVFDQAPFIQESISGLATEGGWGLLFAMATIFLFLWAVRPTLIAGISIPLSLLFAFVGMLVTGTTMNMMSLAGLMLAIGRMVDDSIVVVENIVRHLEQSVKPKFRTIIDAVTEVAGAVISSTIVALLVFLPLVIVSGVAGELFRPFALTTVLALSGSLLVSLTIVPVLAYWFLKAPKGAAAAADPDPDSVQDTDGEADPAYGSEVDQDATTQASTGWLARLYRPGLAWAIRHRAITIVGAIALFVGSLALTPLLKVNLLGEDGMNTVMLTQTLPVGTTLEQSLAAAEETEPLLMDLAGAETVQTSIGGDGFGFGAATPNVISYTVVMEPGTDMEWAEARISQVTGQHADTGGDEVGSIDIAQGGAMMGSNTVDVVIQGLDDEAREAASDQVVEALTGIDGSAGVVSNLDATAPALQVTIRPADAAQYGMSAAQASGLIAMQTAEFPVGSLTVDGTDLSVYFATAGGVETVEEVEALDLGGLPLSAIADVNRVEVPPSFTTRNAVRTVTVSVTPASTDDVGALGTQVAETVDGLELPEGVTWRMGGVTADMDEAFGQLGLAMLAAILLIYVVMVWLFKSLMQPLILLMSVPFAITGVILALLVTGHPIGLPSLVGLLMLIGIVVTNAIVLIDLINQYRRRGMTLEDAILRGGQNRVRPIIMTAAATITAMLPPALGLASQSSFVSGPMAISVIGGLIASTLITLIIIPVLYSLFESFQERRASRGRHRPESVEAAAEADDAAAAPA